MNEFVPVRILFCFILHFFFGFSPLLFIILSLIIKVLPLSPFSNLKMP